MSEWSACCRHPAVRGDMRVGRGARGRAGGAGRGGARAGGGRRRRAARRAPSAHHARARALQPAPLHLALQGTDAREQNFMLDRNIEPTLIIHSCDRNTRKCLLDFVDKRGHNHIEHFMGVPAVLLGLVARNRLFIVII